MGGFQITLQMHPLTLTNCQLTSISCPFVLKNVLVKILYDYFSFSNFYFSDFSLKIPLIVKVSHWIKTSVFFTNQLSLTQSIKQSFWFRNKLLCISVQFAFQKVDDPFQLSFIAFTLILYSHWARNLTKSWNFDAINGLSISQNLILYTEVATDFTDCLEICQKHGSFGCKAALYHFNARNCAILETTIHSNSKAFANVSKEFVYMENLDYPGISCNWFADWFTESSKGFEAIYLKKSHDLQTTRDGFHCSLV